MARLFSLNSHKLLKVVSQNNDVLAKELFDSFSRSISYKDFYNNIYRLINQGLLEKKKTGLGVSLHLTEEGKKFINRFSPQKDGVWKIIIFDIPEKQKYVRVVLRAKLKTLHFKKWQNSIWVSPYALEPEIEDELKELGKKFFVRLIKTSDINFTDDLEKLFS